MPRRYYSWLIAVCLVATPSGVAAGDFSTNDFQTGVVRFLVGEIGSAVHKDSYVLTLSELTDIAHARELITSGPSAGATIAVCNIAKGANGINRNYLAAGAPAWSWHVTSLEGFADNTIEILDGWPTYVESDVDGWIANTGGKIGFWRYTVVAELPTGDYDADLDVDADDFAAWRVGFGGTADLSADGSGNGIVDATDYVLWRKNLGRRISLPASGSSIAVGVPEPGVLSLALIGAAVLLTVRYRRR